MSNKEQKAVKKSAKHVDNTLPSSDDSKNPDALNPADNPAIGTSEMGSHSSGSDVQGAREPVQKRMQDFKVILPGFLWKRGSSLKGCKCLSEPRMKIPRVI